VARLPRAFDLPNETTLHRLARILEVSLDDPLIERSARSRNRPIEHFQATELLKLLDERKLKLALSVLKAISSD
jgi:hypothetical protein